MILISYLKNSRVFANVVRFSNLLELQGWNINMQLKTKVSSLSSIPKSNFKNNVVSCPFPAIDIPEKPLHEFVFDNLELHGDRNFMINGLTSENYTFNETKNLVAKVANFLIRNGLKAGNKVALYSFNLPEYYLAWLGVIAAGGVTIDINPNFTPREVKNMLDETEPEFIFTHTKCLEIVKQLLTKSTLKKVIVLDSNHNFIPFTEVVSDSYDINLVEGARTEPKTTLASLFGSSGTTGLPKLVCKSHYSLVASALATKFEEMHLPGDVGLLVLPFYHIYAHLILLEAIHVGKTMVILPGFEPVTFLNSVQKYKVSSIALVPPLVLFLLQHPLVGKYDLNSLKYVNCGAAPLPKENIANFKDKFHIEFFRQGYGLTEIVPLSVCVRSGKDSSSIGVPTNQSKIKIVDVHTGESLGPNEPGEIVAKGPCDMMGYLNNPTATSETIENGWIKTGDIGHYDDDLNFYIVDRIKDLIKYKGHQVAPAEIEGLLFKHPAVKDAAVIGIPDEKAGELTKAFVVIKEEMKDQIKAKELIKFVAGQTAKEKHLYGGVTFLDQIPKSPSGKILKKELRKLN